MKWLVLGLVIVLSSCMLISQDKKSDDDFLNVQVLINQDLDGNFKLIQSKADKLSSSQRLYIYEDKSKSGTLPFILNLLLGFGIGSWVQGDLTGGLIGTIGGVTGVGMMLVEDTSIQNIGAGILLASWVTDLILPWTFASSYNSTLKNALRMSELSDIRFVPSINIAKNNLIYPTANLRIQF